ncbi:MAG: DUF5667 domain-containing protein [Candidatus Spechtbacterales bacterium]
MDDQTLRKQLKELKQIKPQEDWAVSARANLIAHIDASQEALNPHQSAVRESASIRGSWFERTLAQPKWAGAFTLGIFALMVLSATMAQNSLPGSPLYGAKLAGEDLRSAVTFSEMDGTVLQAKYAERRVNEISRIASTRFAAEGAASFNPELAEGVSEALESYKKDIALAKESGNKETIEKEVAQVNEKVEVWTSLVNEKDPYEALNIQVSILMEACADEALLEESGLLLEEGGLRNIITAFELLNRCEEVEITSSDDENISDEPTDSGELVDGDSTDSS